MSDSAASRLCIACGMCCDGTMFHHVRLQPKDSPKSLVALGLKLKRKRKHDHILQPCQAHRDGCCSIYLERPERCRLFECQQIQRVELGAITEAEAGAMIRDALARRDHLYALFEESGESNSKGPLTRRCEKILADLSEKIDEPKWATLRERLSEAMAAFETLLDREFRNPADPESASEVTPAES